MKVYAIGDLHLSSASPKEMDIFGSDWENHPQRIREAVQETVSAADVLLIPGDISWAMNLSDALGDLDFIAAFPGKKVLLRGNHDYWWPSPKKLGTVLGEGMHFIQNNSVQIGDLTLCGSRGWVCPGSATYKTQEDEKIYLRELERLELSLKSANGGLIIGMLHFPPYGDGATPSGFTQLFEKYGAREVVFGHIHGKTNRQECEQLNGVRYHLVSCDALGFAPKLICEL